MQIVDIFEDRRNERSSFISQSLHYQLKAIALRHGLPSVVLSDRLGNLWAASHYDGTAPGMAQAMSRMTGFLDEQGYACAVHGQGPLLWKQLRVQAATLYIGTPGHGETARSALDQAGLGVQRILSGAA